MTTSTTMSQGQQARQGVKDNKNNKESRTTSTTRSQGQQARQGVKDDKDYKDDNKVNNDDNDDVFRCANHVLYANRAAALLKRAFRGDVYAALRDCLSALNLNPRYVKAHLRLGKPAHF